MRACAVIYAMKARDAAGPERPRPLVVRCGALGDMVLITALIGELAARFASAVDVLTSGPWSEPLLRGQPGVGDIVVVRSRKTPYWLSRDQRYAVSWLRRRGAGPVWYCDGNDAAMRMLERAEIADDCIVSVRDHPLLAGEHATQQWRRMARLAPATAPVQIPGNQAIAAAPGGCRLEVSDAERSDLARWLQTRGLAGRPLLALQAGNKRTMRRGLRRLAANQKYWPVERWAAVLKHLRTRHPDHHVVLLGTGPEYALNRDLIAAAAVEGLHNAADDLGVTRLMALLARAQGLVSVDSGPAHVAAAVGCPQVVLFGKASTVLYRPWGTAGADVRVLTGRLAGEASMLGIDAARVAAAWDSLTLRSDAGAPSASLGAC